MAQLWSTSSAHEGRRYGTIHIDQSHMATAPPELRQQHLEETAASWRRSGYAVEPVPRDGLGHTFNEPCQACRHSV